jgi:hypothetical protein
MTDKKIETAQKKTISGKEMRWNMRVFMGMM